MPGGRCPICRRRRVPCCCDARTRDEAAQYERNIEQFIGVARVPVGLIGPIRVNGMFANRDYYVPLATTEAALVASYARGARLITEAGGCTTLVVNEGVSRAPGFAFDTVVDAALFIAWTHDPVGRLPSCGRRDHAPRRAGRSRVTLEGNHAYLGFEFTTGDASGQNMVTLATEAICRYIEAQSPVIPSTTFSRRTCRRQEGHGAVVSRRPRTEGHRRSAAAGGPGRTTPAHDAGPDGRLLADVRPRRRHERQPRRAGALRQRPGGALHRLRPGRGHCRRSRRRRHPLRTARRWRPVCGGDACRT